MANYLQKLWNDDHPRWLCRMFGHRPWSENVRHNAGAEYFHITTVEIDGIGREHAHLKAECSRCYRHFNVGKVHLPAKTNKEQNNGNER